MSHSNTMLQSNTKSLSNTMSQSDTFMIQLSQAGASNAVVVQTTSGQLPASQDHLHGGFNLGLHVADDATMVHQNRATLLAQLQRRYPKIKRIHWLNQVHGDTVYHVTDALSVRPIDADAHITTNTDTALAIMTADCVPVMISAPLANGHSLVAAIHAGWQGIAKGIIAKTVQKMAHQLTMINQDLAADELTQVTQHWQAWIGACIAQDSYEVDSRVKDGVMASIHVDKPIAERLFRANPEKLGHYFANLAYAAQLQLNACGIHQVSQSCLNSHADTRFYSYRRQTQQQLPTTGRMATLIFNTL